MKKEETGELGQSRNGASVVQTLAPNKMLLFLHWTDRIHRETFLHVTVSQQRQNGNAKLSRGEVSQEGRNQEKNNQQ